MVKRFVKAVKAYFAKKEKQRVIEARIAALDCTIMALGRALNPYLNKAQIDAVLAETERVCTERKSLKAQLLAL